MMLLALLTGDRIPIGRALGVALPSVCRHTRDSVAVPIVNGHLCLSRGGFINRVLLDSNVSRELSF